MRKQRTGLKKEQFLTIVILMILWQLLALSVNNDILIPMPLDVAQRMLADVSQPAFYAQTLSTLGRMLKGFGISLILALVCGFAAATQPVIRRLIEPLEVIVKTIPNLSYIMIFLIWLGSEGSVMVTSFCVLFPVFYTAVLLSQDLLDSELQDVLRCYPERFVSVFWKVRLPQALPHLLAAMKTGFGLGLRVCVMAEVLTQVRVGIGRQMSYAARIALDMTGLFAWTLWIILISAAADGLFSWLQKKVESSL